jgi:hypothetical protein
MSSRERRPLIGLVLLLRTRPRRFAEHLGFASEVLQRQLKRPNVVVQTSVRKWVLTGYFEGSCGKNGVVVPKQGIKARRFSRDMRPSHRRCRCILITPAQFPHRTPQASFGGA